MEQTIKAFLIGIFSGIMFVNAKGQNTSNIKVTEIEDIKVHTYVNESLVSISTHILELRDSLLIIDAQLTYTDTKEVVEYVKKLNKPVSRVIITHAHPDHFLGIYAYAEYKIYALNEVAQAIEENGEGARQIFLSNFGSENAAPEVLVPSYTLSEGKTTVNNVELEVSVVKDNEIDIATVISIPSKGIFIAGDLLYNKVHLFPGHNHLTSWMKQLKELRLKSKYILPGHGAVGSKKMIKENIKYLKNAIEIAREPGMDVPNYKAKLVEQYPEYKSAILIDFGGAALFKEQN